MSEDFLNKVIPLARQISDWTRDKAIFIRKKIVSPILPSVVVADIVIQSGWGSHPLSQPHFNKKYANNLTLMEADDFWQGRVHVLKTENGADKEYRAYQDWIHFATDYSDMIIFTKLYDNLLNTTDYKLQIRELSKFRSDPNYCMKSEALIDFYVLNQL